MNLANALDAIYARLERQLLELAQAMPAEKYGFRPSPDVRTFGEQVIHVGAVQWVVGASLLRQSPTVDVGDGDSGPVAMTAKTDILKYTSDSFACIRGAIATMQDSEALEWIPHPYDPDSTKVQRLMLIAGYSSHGWEHYGQIVVYARIQGLTPPSIF